MKRWKVIKKKKGKWKLVGVYSDKFVEQMCGAVSFLTKSGYEMYDTIRVKEFKPKKNG